MRQQKFQKAGDGMTAERAEAIKMIEELPEDTLHIAVQYIRNLRIKQKKEADMEANLRALEEIKAMAVKIPEDFDYDRELEEALEEKYGRLLPE